LAAVAGLVPFFHLPTSFRTQFFAAPGEAALLACAFGVLAGLLPAWPGRLLAAACTGLLVAGATGAAHRAQATLRPVVCYERTVHVLEQVRAATTGLPPDVLLLFLLDGGSPALLGPNYAFSELSRNLLGVRACQAECIGPEQPPTQIGTAR